MMEKELFTRDEVTAFLKKMWEEFSQMRYDGYKGIVDLGYEFYDGEDDFVEWALKLEE